MSIKKKSDSYEVGYGKPPKKNQFSKGVSGNPTGRPKKATDFFAELMKEASSFITITDNGRRTRIPKAHGIAKQLTNKALQGEQWAIRLYFAVYPQAREQVDLLAAQQPIDITQAESVHDLTRDQLMRIAALGLKDIEPEDDE